MMVSDSISPNQVEVSQHAPPSPEKAWKKVHPASIFINLIPQLIRILRGLWLILLFLFFAEGQQNFFDTSFFLILLGMSVYRTVIHFLTLRYRLTDNFLEIKLGLFYRQHRRLDIARIQNIEIKQNPLHKFFRLSELHIETAGSSEEGLLSALRITDAQHLRDQIIQERGQAKEKAEPDQLLQLSTLDLLLYGLTSNQVGTVVVLSAVGSEALSLINPHTAQELASNISLYNAVGIILLSFAASWLWSCFRAIMQHHKYQLFLSTNSLQTIDGLITKRKVEIPRNKVQLALLVEPWLRRLVGYGTLHIETAAFGVEDGQTRKTEGIIPMLEKERFSEFLTKTTPLLDVDPWTEQLLPAHPNALYRGIFRGLIQSLIPVAVLIFMFREQPYATTLLSLTLLSIPLSILDWKGQGWLITPNSIVSRRGYLNRKTWIIDRHKIQSIHIYQSPFMRVHNLAHLIVYVAGTEIVLPDVLLEKAHDSYENLNTQWKQRREQLSEEEPEEESVDTDHTVAFDESMNDTEIIE
jgi:putative membrane protein